MSLLNENKQAKTVEYLLLPNLLLIPEFVSGLRQPLEAVADVLDEQDKHDFAVALRNAATICESFSKIVLEKTHDLAVC